MSSFEESTWSDLKPMTGQRPIPHRFSVFKNVSIADHLRRSAAAEGFAECRITPAVTSGGFDDLVRWVQSGYAAGMDYFQNRLDAYRHPGNVLAGCRSIAVLVKAYPAAAAPPLPPGHGRVARYAWSGVDYHDTIHASFKRIIGELNAVAPQARFRGVVDTAPIMEREVAERAGIGWRGKNTLLLSRTHGSYFFLACLLADIELPYDEPTGTGHCGTCTACLDACPTDAFASAGVLDARRCISYLTIEHRGEIPPTLQGGVGDWLFGCDVCQEVCPWNRKLSRGQTVPADAVTSLDAAELAVLDDETFRNRYRRSAFWRTRPAGMRRNAVTVLGNALKAENAGLEENSD